MSSIKVFETPWGETYENVEVEVGHYRNGSLAIRLTLPDDGDEVLAIPTINLEQYGVVPPNGSVFIPGYSENKGMLAALVAAGVVEAEEKVVYYGPFDASAQRAKVLPPFLPQEV